jgi:hypothetical protein
MTCSNTRRSKLTPGQIRATLFTTCTECGHKIYPAELRFVDGKRCRCPQCLSGHPKTGQWCVRAKPANGSSRIRISAAAHAHSVRRERQKLTAPP